MKNALISPQETVVRYISGWTNDDPPKPIFSDLSNACRIAQVEDATFDVAPPLYWVECADNVNAYEFYFDTQDELIKPIPNLLPPN